VASSNPIDLKTSSSYQFHELPLLVLLGHHMEQCQSPLGVQADSTSHIQGRLISSAIDVVPKQSRVAASRHAKTTTDF
jgi:hypothetical protein